MRITGRPENKWGWVRIASVVILAGIIVWTFLAVLGQIFQTSWHFSPSFTLLDGIELAIIPLLTLMVSGWMEEQDVKAEREKASHQETEHVLAARRKAVLKHFHDTITAILADDSQATHPQTKIMDALHLTLAELDGLGKGEVLMLLHEKGLLAGDTLTDFHNTDFRGAELRKAHLEGARLERIDLHHARLDDAHLVDVQLQGANLGRAILRQANLNGAVLAGSNLRCANLENANLEAADLSHACLVDAFCKKTTLLYCTGVHDAIETCSEPHGEQADPMLQSTGSASLDQAILIEVILPDGRKFTNQKGREFLRKKEIEALIDRL